MISITWSEWVHRVSVSRGLQLQVNASILESFGAAKNFTQRKETTLWRARPLAACNWKKTKREAKYDERASEIAFGNPDIVAGENQNRRIERISFLDRAARAAQEHLAFIGAIGVPARARDGIEHSKP